jgi:hypothetical protein
MAHLSKHGLMEALIDDLELAVLKTPAKQKNVTVSGEDLLILIEYTRQCEYVIKMMDADPKKAKDSLTR